MSYRAQIIEIIDPCLNLSNGNRIFSTLEGENPGGSMKDHMVRGEIEDLLRKKILNAGAGISEVSAGSTATSLAHYCPLYGLKCVLFVPTGISEDIFVGLKDKGAEIHQEEMSVIYGNYDQFLGQHGDLVRFDQLYDTNKRRHYHSLGFAIRRELGAVDAVIGGVGTGHSLLGTAQGLNAKLVVSAEPAQGFKVSGVRNITSDRYGDQDSISPQDFHQTIIVSPQQMIATDLLQTSVGVVESGRSFNLVLSALCLYLRDKSNQKIFAIGASLKRVEFQAIRRTA